ncbi:MAG: hypothetical protein ABI253_01715 [Mycobacterium sp.]
MEPTSDDPNNEPTRMADYDYRGGGNYSEPVDYSSQYLEPTGQQPDWSEPPGPPSTPWYLRPLALIGWGVLTAILIAALVWGMVRLVNKDTGHSTPATTSVSSTTAPAAEEPAGPSPEPVAPDTPFNEIPPAAPTTEPPTTTPPTTTAPITTESPTTTATTTTTPTTTVPTTQAPTTTTRVVHPPSEIVIPLPPGL